MVGATQLTAKTLETDSLAWSDFEKWWIGNKTARKEESTTIQYEHHPLIAAAMNINNSCIGVINIKSMQYTYLSLNFESFIELSREHYFTGGVKWVFSRIHSDDLNGVLKFSELINNYFKDLPAPQKPFYQSCWDFRIKTERGEYVKILQQDCVLSYDQYGKIEELLFVVAKIDNVVSSDNQHLKMTNGIESVFYKYDRTEKTTIKLDLLSMREIEIAKLIAKSRSMKQIGAQLGISFNTVKVHSANMMKKLMVNDSIELVSLLRTWRFI